MLKIPSDIDKPKLKTKSKKMYHLNEIQRGQIEILLKIRIPKAQTAEQVGIARSTLYLELKRGTVTQMNSDLTYRKEYFADTGERVYKEHRKNCRKPFKISQVEEFITFDSDIFSPSGEFFFILPVRVQFTINHCKLNLVFVAKGRKSVIILIKILVS